MAIPAAAQVPDLVAPQLRLQTVDPDTGIATQRAHQFNQQHHNFLNGMNRIIPCNCTNVANLYTLTTLSMGPLVTQYADYDMFGFVASATSTGLVTANVATPTGTFATLNVYKTNGSAQATLNDITINLQYFFTYVDSLSAGAGGFVLR